MILDIVSPRFCLSYVDFGPILSKILVAWSQ